MLVSFREQRWQGAKQGRLLEGRKGGKARVHHQLLHIEGQLNLFSKYPFPLPSTVGRKYIFAHLGELGRCTGEGMGYPLQYSWASPMAQLVKNAPAMWETWVRSLGWEDFLEKGKATQSSILAWRIPWGPCVHGVSKSRIRLSKFHFHFSQGLLSSVKY